MEPQNAITLTLSQPKYDRQSDWLQMKPLKTALKSSDPEILWGCATVTGVASSIYSTLYIFPFSGFPFSLLIIVGLIQISFVSFSVLKGWFLQCPLLQCEATFLVSKLLFEVL